MRKGSVVLILGLFVGVMSLVYAQAESVAPLKMVSYEFSSVEDDNARGFVQITDYGLGAISIVINARGVPARRDFPAHFHSGDCGSGGDVVVPLNDVDGATGLSVTFSTATFDDVVNGNHYLNIHASADNMGSILACGEIGLGVEGVEGGIKVMAAEDASMMNETSAESTASDQTTGQTATGVRPEEFETSLRTAGYLIFAVGGSNIRGQLQVSDEIDVGSKVVVTLDGMQSGMRYPAAIRRGDCGPDGEELLRLNHVPYGTNDPLVSITMSSLSYEDIAEANNYVHIFDPNNPSRVVACGEVGLGANR